LPGARGRRDNRTSYPQRAVVDRQEINHMKAAVRWFYMLATFAVFVDVCLQFYFAAYGAFSKSRVDFSLHSLNASILLVLMLVALLLSILAVATAGLRWPRVLLQLLLPILLIGQIGIFILHDAVGGSVQNPISAVLGLHALNGLLIFGLAFTQGRAALRLVRAGGRQVQAKHTAPAQVPG